MTNDQVIGIYADNRIMKRASGETFWCHVTGRAFNKTAREREVAAHDQPPYR